MKKIIVVMVLIIACMSLYAATDSESIPVKFKIGEGSDTEMLKVWLVSEGIPSTSSNPFAEDPTGKLIDSSIGVSLTLDSETGKAELTSGLHIWVKSTGYSDVDLKLTADKDLTNASAGDGVPSSIEWTTKLEGMTDLVSGDTEKSQTLENITGGSASIFAKSYPVKIETEVLPAGADGEYTAKLTVGVTSN